jgi:hypothetical protein
MKQTRHLLRRLLLSMVSLQQCKDRASSDLCTTPPSKFQRHHHCRLLTLLQRSAHSCTDELHCKQQSELVGCSLAWQSNTAALQWLFPRHMYCGDTQVKNVNAKSSAEKCLIGPFYPTITVSNCAIDRTSKNCRR